MTGPYRGVILGRIVVTSTVQGAGAPIVDTCIGGTRDGRRYSGRAVLVKPWKRGERSGRARALVFGWIRP